MGKKLTGLFESPAGVGKQTFIDVVAAATAAYNIKRRVPTVEEISAHTNREAKTISRVIVTPEFKELMRNRGYPFDHVKMTPEQVWAAAILTDPTNKKPLSAKLKQAGITMATYRAWLKQPHFKEYVETISEQMLGEHIQDVHTMVVNKATSGDLTAAKMYYELNGRLDPNKQQMTDLNGVIGLLLEVITRYVTDVGVLTKINKDIDVLLSGGTPRAMEEFDIARIAAGAEEIEDAVVVEDAPVGAFFDFEKG